MNWLSAIVLTGFSSAFEDYTKSQLKVRFETSFLFLFFVLFLNTTNGISKLLNKYKLSQKNFVYA